jgi:hypothetical protein
MWLPAGSSPEFAKKLSAAAAEILKRPEVREKLNAVSLIPVGSTPEDQSARGRHRVLATDREGDGLQDHELEQGVPIWDRPLPVKQT